MTLGWGIRLAVLVPVTAAGVGAMATAASATPATTAVVQATALNVRTGPATWHSRVASVPGGTRLTVACQVSGQLIAGAVRRTAVWDRLRDGRYVSDAYVSWRPARPAVPTCATSPTSPTAPAAPASRGSFVDTGGIPLNVRGGPATWYPRIGRLANGTRVTVTCQARGQYVRGSSLWDRIAGGRYVSDAYVTWRPARPVLPWCHPQPPSREATFIAWAAGPARETTKRYGIPASVTIAQSILESGWGRSSLTTVDHNYFGIKCFGSPGGIAIGCRTYRTSECEGTWCYPTSASFRVYRTATDSFLDHGRFLVVNGRYRPAFAHTGDPDRFATEIHRAGYATSPSYARSLIGLMRQYDLYRYDRAAQ